MAICKRQRLRICVFMSDLSDRFHKKERYSEIVFSYVILALQILIPERNAYFTGVIDDIFTIEKHLQNGSPRFLYIMMNVHMHILQNWLPSIPSYLRSTIDTILHERFTYFIEAAKQTDALDLADRRAGRLCAGCGANRTQCHLQKCAACMTTYYCGVDCQKKEWPAHKGVCGGARARGLEAEVD